MEFYIRKGRGWLAVRSGSMTPLIQPGNRVLMSPVMAEQICCGDIVVFRRSGSLIVHRVLKKRHTSGGSYFIEKGDNFPSMGRFSADDVIGKVTMVIGNGKIFNLSSPFSRLISRLLSMCFYCTSVIIARLRHSRRRNIRVMGKIILRLSLLYSQILIRICSAVWYLSGLNCRHVNRVQREMTNMSHF